MDEVPKWTSQKTTNVFFEGKRLSSGNFLWYDTIVIKATRNIFAKEEIFIDYESEYRFS